MTSTNSTSPRSSMSDYYKLLGDRIGMIAYSIIYIFGFIGNALALITFSNKRMRKISSSIFLLVLSISDSIALVTSIWFFLYDAFSISLQDYSALACRFRMFFAYVSMDLSSWCIAGLTLDRYLRARLVWNSRTVCTPRNASIFITILFITLCGINGHYLSPAIGEERNENRTKAHCKENRVNYPNYFYFYKKIWPKIDIIVFCFLPACIMIVCNIKVVSILKQRRHSFEQKNTRRKRGTHYQTFGSRMSSQKPLNTYRKIIERQMTLMITSSVIAFLLTTLPVSLYLIILEEIIIKIPNLVVNNQFYTFVFRLLRTLMYIHFGSNFYLYCLTSPMFRNEFLQTISCQRCNLKLISNKTDVILLNKLNDTSNFDDTVANKRTSGDNTK